MSKHTPGPWYWSENYQTRDLSDTWSLLGANGHGILSCDGLGNSPPALNPANARLIAAAPELLEALQYAIKQIPELATVPGIAAAIAKATGEPA